MERNVIENFYTGDGKKCRGDNGINMSDDTDNQIKTWSMGRNAITNYEIYTPSVFIYIRV